MMTISQMSKLKNPKDIGELFWDWARAEYYYYGRKELTGKQPLKDFLQCYFGITLNFIKKRKGTYFFEFQTKKNIYTIRATPSNDFYNLKIDVDANNEKYLTKILKEMKTC